MDHSIYGYLDRQPTQILETILDEYMKAEPSQVQEIVVKAVLDILWKRKHGETKN